MYSRRLDGLSVGEFAVGAGAELPHHRHERPHIALVTGGSLQSVGASSETIGEGEGVAYPASLAHRNLAGRRAVKAIAIDVEPDDPFGAHDALGSITAPRMLPRAETRATATRLARALRTQGRAAALLVTGLALELIALAVRERDDATIEEAKAFIRANRGVTPRDVANAAGYSPAHFARLFREQTGRTLAEQIRLERASAAAEDLASTDDALADIAIRNGFCDQSHLTNVFRATFGVTPAAYRRERRRP